MDKLILVFNSVENVWFDVNEQLWIVNRSLIVTCSNIKNLVTLPTAMEQFSSSQEYRLFSDVSSTSFGDPVLMRPLFGENLKQITNNTFKK